MGEYTQSNVEIKSLLASTTNKFMPTLVDNIIADSLLLTLFGHRDIAPMLRKARKPESGVFPEGIDLTADPGARIQFPLMFKKNTTVQSYGGHDTLDITPQDPFTAALYDWRSIAGSINLANEDIAKNSGSKTKIFKYLDAHMENLKLSFVDDITDMLLGTRTAGSKETFGLLDIVKDDPTTNPAGGNLGDIDSTAGNATWWRNYTADFSAAAFGTDQTGTGMKAVRKLIRRTTFGNRRPSVLLAGESAFESIENSMINQRRYESPQTTMLAKAGFEAFSVKGVPVAMEKKIETVRTGAGLDGDAIYALHLPYLKIYGMSTRWFRPSSVKEPANQDTIVQHIITSLQFATNARRQQGVLFNIAAV